MASPMVRVPEALKEVVQKLAEIHRQGDKRREVEAGLQRLLAELIEPQQDLNGTAAATEIGEIDKPEGIPVDRTEGKVGEATAPDRDVDTTDSASADTPASASANITDITPDSKIDSKTASTSVVTADIINVEEVVNRLAILEEKLAALEPQARSDSSAASKADDTTANKADNTADNSADATQG